MHARNILSTTLFLSLLVPLSALPLSRPPAFSPRPSRFRLSSLNAAHYTAASPLPASLFGRLAIRPFTPAERAPYAHPRVVVSGSEWAALVDKHVANFRRNASWSDSLLTLTESMGPASPFVARLAALETAAELGDVGAKSRADLSAPEIAALERVAANIKMANEATSHALFLCSFWAAVSDKLEEPFLPPNATRTCVNAAVGWAKVLIAHRILSCEDGCGGGGLAYLWDFSRKWDVSNDWFTSGFSLALTYDVLYRHMKEGERTTVRSALALLVMKRFVWGTAEVTSRSNPNAETHPHRIYGNWALYHSNLYMTNLAIEGETGFLPYVKDVLNENGERGFNEGLSTKFEAMAKAFMVHTINPDGSTFEDGYTYFTAFREGSLGLLATHKRGSGVLAMSRFRNTIHHAAQMFEPWQCGELVGHSSGGGLGYPAFVGLFRYAYPDGPLPRMVWAQRFGREFRNNECRIYWTQTMTQLVIFGDEHLDGRNAVPDSPETLPAEVKKDFPLAYVSARRGLIIGRASYSQRASYFHLDARPDSFLLGHDNADRGVITFSALKRRWLDDLPWKENVDSRKHSLMHVDGLSQAEKAPSVTIIKADEDDEVFIAAADVTYASNVQWARGWQGPNGPGTGETVEYDGEGNERKVEYKFFDAENNSPWDLGWPMEDDAAELGFSRKMSLNGYPDLAFAGIHQWKRNYREQLLSYMVRSAMMVRSEKNEVGFGVVVDTVEIESGKHTFESYLILHDEVRVEEGESRCSANRCKVVLKAEGAEQVDVHVRTMGGGLGYRVERFGGHRRVVVKRSGGRKEAFWMALHPHEGDENGFEMHGGDDGKVRFRYEGRERYFEVGEDHSAVETDAVGRKKEFAMRVKR